MSNEVQVKKLTDIMAQFVGFTAKKLPDDVIAASRYRKGRSTAVGLYALSYRWSQTDRPWPCVRQNLVWGEDKAV